MPQGPKQERERAKLHGPHGWHRSERAHVPQRGRVFMDCPCGWFGWVSDEIAPPRTPPVTS